MAEELRQHTMAVVNVAADFVAGAEFKNTTDTDLFIRQMTISASGQGDAAVAAFGFVEVSKSPRLESVLDESTQPKYRVSFGGSPGAAGLLTGFGNDHTYMFAKGQLVLEPNESLFMHADLGNPNNVDCFADIGYHF